ncbi:hypothetical protein H4J50_10445 [Colwellia sp. 6M3]|uniref:hypothetical protein n=1 Tax=Colwellia sp. 6M3 TaxID=2759849 RepID=UPI0015F37409|nr:hypothetical protein [Colwellia sp. 6M3]MBA6416433.1 hypothetical protein [Colwellia sp. 6M3]
MTEWFQIKVSDVQLSSKQMFMYFSQLEKDELHISPHVKLAGLSKEAHISHIKLAKEFLDKCLPIFKRRYGNETRLDIIKCSSGKNIRLIKRIQQDTQIIQARLITNNMAPNRKIDI